MNFSPTTAPDRAVKPEVKQRFQSALDAIVAKLQQDRYVIAAVLCGSLSYDEVWEKSDIDLLIITTEEAMGKATKTPKTALRSFNLVEDGIPIHAIVMTRSEFKNRLVNALQSSFLHSLFSKSTLLFSHDPTFPELYDQVQHLGARDREIHLLQSGMSVLFSLVKAEKWFTVKHDLDYTFLWLMQIVDSLARIEVLWQGEITGREVVQQALKHNPQFFNRIYTDLINQPKTIASLRAALDDIHAYLHQHLTIYQPILSYLEEANGPRSATEVAHYFDNQMGIKGADLTCEWLAQQGIIDLVSLPMRLSPRSAIDLDEAAYYYGGRR